LPEENLALPFLSGCFQNNSPTRPCPLPTVTKNESCRSPGLRRMGKPTFVMSSVDFHLNFGCAAEGDINLHEMLNRYSLQSAPASNVAPI
jgi:hypothetical protein